MHRKLPFLVFLLFLSGFCSLVYQVAWIREFRMIFGASTPATSAVLAIFMGGLGIGAAAFGGRAERAENPLRLYALLELGVALSVALSPLLVDAVRLLYIQTGGSQAMGLPLATGLRLVLAALVLGLPCVLMGGNLPAAVKFIQTNRDGRRRAVAALYGLNAMGAVLGAFTTTFWMLERWGTRESLFLACALNLAIGAVALLVSRRASQNEARDVEPFSRFEPEPYGRKAPVSFLYGCAFLCGSLFFVIELVWYRMLIPLLGGSVYAFGLILTVALLGIGIGGVLYAIAGPSRVVTLRTFGLVSALQACAVGLPYALGDRLAVFAYHANALSSFELPGQIVGWSATTSIVVLLPSVIAGFQFPLLVALLGEGNPGVGTQLGRTYAWNTFGAIAGALCGGFLLIPALTAPVCWLVVTGLIAAMAAAALILDLILRAKNSGASRDWGWGAGWLAPSTCVVLAVVCLFTTGPTAAWRHVPIGYGRVGKFPKTVNERKDWVRQMNRRMLYDFDGRESSIALIGMSEIAFFVNGKSDGSARSDAGTQVMLGLLPALLHGEAENACVVGLGTGCTAGWLADVPGMEQVDVIELEPGMRRIARDFAPVNRYVLEKGNVNVIDGDAREILLTRGPEYDLIASAPSNPYRAGVASLYTREYYRAVQDRLAEGGLFAQWVQCYEIDTDSVRTLYATLSSVFESVETWATQPRDFVFICSNERPVYSLARMRERIREAPFAEALRKVWYTDRVEGVLERCVANSDFSRRIARQTPAVNTDNRNLLEYGYARYLGRWTRFNTFDVAVAANEAGMRFPPLVEGGGMVADARQVDQSIRDGEGARSMQQLVAAESHAMAGSPGAEEKVAAIETAWPLEAKVLRAHIAFQRGDYAGSAERLVEALMRFRQEPWARVVVMQSAFELAVGVAGRHEDAAEVLFLALEQPFCMRSLEKERLESLFVMAKTMAPEFQVRAVDAWGSHFPWDEEFLQRRLACYRATGDSRFAAARSDYLSYQEHEDARFTLTEHEAWERGGRFESPGGAGDRSRIAGSRYYQD